MGRGTGNTPRSVLLNNGGKIPRTPKSEPAFSDDEKELLASAAEIKVKLTKVIAEIEAVQKHTEENTYYDPGLYDGPIKECKDIKNRFEGIEDLTPSDDIEQEIKNLAETAALKIYEFPSYVSHETSINNVADDLTNIIRPPDYLVPVTEETVVELKKKQHFIKFNLAGKDYRLDVFDIYLLGEGEGLHSDEFNKKTLAKLEGERILYIDSSRGSSYYVADDVFKDWYDQNQVFIANEVNKIEGDNG